MANTDWSFLWEAFAIASGIPPSVWRTAPDQRPATAQSEARILEVTLKEEYRLFLEAGHWVATSEEGKHDE